MVESDSSQALGIKEVLQISTKTEAANGVAIYTAPFADIITSHLGEVPYQIAMSAEGQELLARDPNALEFLRKPLSSFREYDVNWGGKVTRHRVGGLLKGEQIAVKQIDPRSFDITMLDQFMAMKFLMEEGVKCATPFFATNWRLVMPWISGRNPAQYGDRDFKTYVARVEEIFRRLREEGKIKPRWKIDSESTNYIIDNKKSPNILDHYVTIDPIYTRTQMLD
jgi:hypothetical protein